jgi:hypothetical protein
MYMLSLGADITYYGEATLEKFLLPATTAGAGAGAGSAKPAEGAKSS